MGTHFSKEVKADLFKLGVYQICGGLIGIAIIAKSAINAGFFNEMVLLFYFIFLLFFGYSIFCGWLCVKYREHALTFSFVNQLLQLVHVYIAGFSFSYTAGFHLDMGIDLTNSFRINFDAGLSNLMIFINNRSETILFNFNLLAFYLVYWIDRLIKQVKLENEIQQADSIGGVQAENETGN
jgi:hypothetical protein